MNESKSITGTQSLHIEVPELIPSIIKKITSDLGLRDQQFVKNCIVADHYRHNTQKKNPQNVDEYYVHTKGLLIQYMSNLITITTSNKSFFRKYDTLKEDIFKVLTSIKLLDESAKRLLKFYHIETTKKSQSKISLEESTTPKITSITKSNDTQKN
jgi:hypothetical protein